MNITDHWNHIIVYVSSTEHHPSSRTITHISHTNKQQKNMMDGDTKTVRCPDCKVYIPCTDRNRDVRLAEHISSGCTKHAKKSKKSRCSFEKCKAKLEKYEQIKCRDCKHLFCVKHRSHHKCGDSSVLRGNRRVRAVQANRTMNKIREAQYQISKNGLKLLGSAYLEPWKQEKILEMTNLLKCTPERALNCLKQGRWNLERAAGYYFGS